MLSIYDQGGFAPCPAAFNLAAHVLSAGTERPEKDALLIVGDDHVDRWSYAALRAAVLGAATGLRDEGLSPGDMVLLRLGNTVDFPLAYLAALAVNLVPVPTSPALTERETQTIIEMLRPQCILHDPAIPCPDTASVQGVDTLRSWYSRPPAACELGDPDRLGYVVFTSGTSGQPRAVAHAHRAIWARQMMFQDWYALRADDRVLHAGAFNWTYTLGTGLMDPWTMGATAVIPAPGPAPERLLDLMATHEATIFAAAPGVYRQLLKTAAPRQLPALRHGLSAGEKLPETTAARWQAVTGCAVYEAFGMSECSTFVSQRPGDTPEPGTLGLPQQGRRLALLQDGVPVPRGAEGTIAVHRSDPGLMLGYLGAPEATSERMSGDWFLTGDQAVMQPSGALSYIGRDDDMMNAGGFRVSPLEVETVLSTHDEISAVAVTEVEVKPDTFVIAAFYTAPIAVDAEVLRAYVSAKLARYKQPRLFIHTPEIPTGANGKILRSQLRARFKRPQ